MQTTHATFLLAGQTVHRVTFDPATFTEADLLWLPHHHQLSDAGRKRKADHLAGRIAAFHALNRQAIPGIGSIPFAVDLSSSDEITPSVGVHYYFGRQAEATLEFAGGDRTITLLNVAWRFGD